MHTFSPSIINEFRLGFTRVRWNNGTPSDPSGLFGFTGDQTVGIAFGAQKFVGFTGQSLNNNASYIGTSANPQFFTDNTFNYYDNLTWQRGRHLLTIGGQATRYQQNYLNAGNVGFLGHVQLYRAFQCSTWAAAGYGPADFVLGRISRMLHSRLLSDWWAIANGVWQAISRMILSSLRG